MVVTAAYPQLINGTSVDTIGKSGIPHGRNDEF